MKIDESVHKCRTTIIMHLNCVIGWLSAIQKPEHILLHVMNARYLKY